MVVTRAKLQVGMVQEHFYGPQDTKSSETLTMHAAAKNDYSKDPHDEDNTFAVYTPGATLSIAVANPVL